MLYNYPPVAGAEGLIPLEFWEIWEDRDAVSPVMLVCGEDRSVNPRVIDDLLLIGETHEWPTYLLDYTGRHSDAVLASGGTVVHLGTHQGRLNPFHLSALQARYDQKDYVESLVSMLTAFQEVSREFHWRLVDHLLAYYEWREKYYVAVDASCPDFILYLRENPGPSSLEIAEVLERMVIGSNEGIYADEGFSVSASMDSIICFDFSSVDPTRQYVFTNVVLQNIWAGMKYADRRFILVDGMHNVLENKQNASLLVGISKRSRKQLVSLVCTVRPDFLTDRDRVPSTARTYGRFLLPNASLLLFEMPDTLPIEIAAQIGIPGFTLEGLLDTDDSGGLLIYPGGLARVNMG